MRRNLRPEDLGDLLTRPKVATLRDALLPKLISGEIRVSSGEPFGS